MIGARALFPGRTRPPERSSESDQVRPWRTARARWRCGERTGAGMRVDVGEAPGHVASGPSISAGRRHPLDAPGDGGAPCAPAKEPVMGQEKGRRRHAAHVAGG